MGCRFIAIETKAPERILFPQGLVYDYELGRFGTKQISPFYRLVANKKGSEELSKSFLVAGAGLSAKASSACLFWQERALPEFHCATRTSDYARFACCRRTKSYHRKA